MADTVDYSDTSVPDAVNGIMSQQRDPIVADQDFSDHTDVDAALVAHFMNEHSLGLAYDHARNLIAAGQGTPDPSFNPYAWFQATPDNNQDMAYFVRSGHFDSVQSPEEFQARADQIRRELDRAHAIANGGVLGDIGGILVNFLDPLNYIPIVGWAAKAGLIGRAAIMGLNAGAVTLGKEALAHDWQETRSTKQSFMDIGTATALGGGVGLLGGIFYKGHPLQPGNPANVLDVKNHVPLEAGYPGAVKSGGAAAVNPSVDFADGTGLGLIDLLGKKLNSPVPVIRSLQDGEARRIMQDTVHLGVPTTENEAGIATADSAEELLSTKYEARYIALADKLNDAYVDANGTLGQSQFRTNLGRDGAVLGMKNALPEAEWNDALFNRLNDAGYQHPNAVVNQALDTAVPEVRKFLDDFHEAGVRLGKFEPGQKVDNYLEQRYLSHNIAENPDAFEGILLRMYDRNSKAGPTDDWLKEGYGIDREGFDALPNDPVAPIEGQAPEPSKKDILSDWHYDADATRLRAAERTAEAASSDLETAKTAYKLESRAYRKAETATRKVEIANVAYEAKTLEATLGTARERLNLDRANERSFIEAAQAARTKTLARQKAFHAEPTDDLKSLGERLNGEAPESPVAPKVPQHERTIPEAEQAARAKTLGDVRQKQEAKVAAMEARLTKLNEHLDNLRTKAEVLRAERERLVQVRKETNLAARKATRDAQRATARLKAAETRLSYPDFVKELRATLMDRTKTPFGFHEDTVGESGRVKQRGIKLDAQARQELVQRGMIETDVNRLLHGYSRDMGGRLALREKFGSEDMKAQLDRIGENYDGRIKEAEARGDTKAQTALANEREVALKMARVLRDRVLGHYGLPQDPSSAAMFLSRTVRSANFLRFMGGTLLSSVSDLATVSLSHGVFNHLQTSIGKPIAKFAKGMKDREVYSVIYAAENGMLFSRAAKNLDMDELLANRGMGTGWTRKVTSALEGGFKWGSDQMSHLNGMAFWNSRLKFVAGQVQLQNIMADAEMLAKGGALEPHRITEYARFGLDADDLKAMGALLGKHGEKHDNGLIDPNGNAWRSEPGGDRLHDKLLVLLKRATEEAVVSPTMADTPPFMSTAAGKVLFQFQTFGFAAVNKYARNLRYKAVNGQGWDVLMSVTWAMGLGAGIYALKETMKGQPLTTKPAQWVAESLDKSGLTLFLMPAVNSALKLGASAGITQGVLEAPSRYRQASWFSSLFGPTGQLIEDVQKLGTSAAEGDWNKVGEKAYRLAPFNNLFYVDALVKMANGPR